MCIYISCTCKRYIYYIYIKCYSCGFAIISLTSSTANNPWPIFSALLLTTAECEKLMEIYERLEELDADKAEVRASRILFGLGFTPAMQRKKLKDFSGGWRMRVSLARYENGI